MTPAESNPRKNPVTIVLCDDWTGLYVNGRLAVENHFLRPRDVLEALGFSYVVISADPNWLEASGSLPERLEDVERDKC